MINLSEIEGILNYLGKSKNFFQEYEVLETTKIFSQELSQNNYEFGIVCYLKNLKEKALKVSISPKSYFNMKYFLDIHTKYATTAHKLFTPLCNFANINIVCGIVPFYDNGHFISFIVFEKDGEYLCSDCCFTDIICIMQSNYFPIYIHQDIVYILGESSKKIDKDIQDEQKK